MFCAFWLLLFYLFNLWSHLICVTWFCRCALITNPEESANLVSALIMWNSIALISISKHLLSVLVLIEWILPQGALWRWTTPTHPLPHLHVSIRCLVHVLKTPMLKYTKIRPYLPQCQLDMCRHAVRYGCQREDFCFFAHSFVELQVWMMQREQGGPAAPTQWQNVGEEACSYKALINSFWYLCRY